VTAYLADSCALIAFHGRLAQPLGEAGLAAMREGDVQVSPISVWEIERKSHLGRLPRPVPPAYRGGLVDFLREHGYRIAPFSWEDAAAAARLPEHHRDPMDRMLIATALRLGLTIVTSDQVFQSYGVPTIW
jgi:PIN domain nuclease of toxin-antitoxin system